MTSMIKVLCIMSLSFAAIITITSAASTFSVMSYGAKADGKTDSTQAFLKAWSTACSSVPQAIMYVPNGRFLIKAAVFRGPCKNRITVRIDGTLVAPDNYWDLGSSGFWLLFNQISQLSVIGGTLDAKGAPFWACRTRGGNCPIGARSITFNWVTDGLLSGLTSINSQLMHVTINNCKNVRVQSVRIIAPDLSPNTDGIHVQASTDITIFSNNIQTGDDCISIGPGTRNLWMEKIQCGPGHGVSIGSLGSIYNEAGVMNVTLTNSVFIGSDNGIRIKSWARPSTAYVSNVNFKNLIMKNVANPIIIDQNYCPHNEGCSPGKSSGVKINQVSYQNIQGTSRSPIAIVFDCSASNPCQGIIMQDVKLTHLTQNVTSFCKNIAGKSSGIILPQACI